MLLTRRYTLYAGGALLFMPVLTRAAKAADDPNSAMPVRMRLENFSKDAQRVASLRRGVQVMKARYPSDPSSWFFQAAIHGVTKEAVAAAGHRDPQVASVDQERFWNQCPHFDRLGASSLSFLVWHRAYLYYFERILRKAAGDPTLALPYWNYEDPQQRTLPAIFADASNNPLFAAERTQALKDGGRLSPATVDTTIAFRRNSFLGRAANDGFGGALSDVEPAEEGVIEQQPHNAVHGAVGGSFRQADGSEGDGLMGSVETAAFDPIFWVHHANVDRLWTIWECRNRVWGSDPEKDPLRAWLSAAPWWFHDADGSVRNLSRATYVRRDRLGIRYDTDDGACTPLAITLPHTATSVTVSAATSMPPGHDMAHMDEAGQKEIGSSGGPVNLSATAPTEQQLTPAAGALAAQPSDVATEFIKPKRTLVEIVGLSAARRLPISYDIYINLPAGTPPDRGLPNFVGTADFFTMTAPATRRVAAFDVTDFLKTIGARAADVKVTLVPRQLVEAPANVGAAVATTAPEIRVEAIRVVTVPVAQ
jgi:hypothetical protein